MCTASAMAPEVRFQVPRKDWAKVARFRVPMESSSSFQRGLQAQSQSALGGSAGRNKATGKPKGRPKAGPALLCSRAHAALRRGLARDGPSCRRC